MCYVFWKKKKHVRSALQFQSNTAAPMQPSEEQEEQEEDDVAWVNAAVGRIFWDFLSEPYWAKMVSKKIQMKLSKIRVSPLFSPGVPAK